MYINIRELSFRYANQNEDVIERFSLSVEKGCKVCILGESGSGKSTLLRLLAGLEVPYAGTIQVENNVLTDGANFIQPEHRGIGMVFQDYALFPHLTVAENIGFGLRKKKRQEKEFLIKEILEIIEMRDYQERYPHELSGGQQQRVALSRALILKPGVLLLDEPLSNLDASLKMKIRVDLKRILEKFGITTIFVTHDREDCIQIADYLVVLRKGRVVQEGWIHELLNRPQSAYVEGLLR